MCATTLPRKPAQLRLLPRYARPVGWTQDGVLHVKSRSTTGCWYRIGQLRGWLTCEPKCESYRRRHICDHIRQAALFLETHEPSCPSQAALWEATREDHLREGIRALLLRRHIQSVCTE